MILRKKEWYGNFKKSLYGLDDASCTFYLKVKETLQELGLKTLPGDDAFIMRIEMES